MRLVFEQNVSQFPGCYEFRLTFFDGKEELGIKEIVDKRRFKTGLEVTKYMIDKLFYEAKEQTYKVCLETIHFQPKG